MMEMIGTIMNMSMAKHLNMTDLHLNAIRRTIVESGHLQIGPIGPVMNMVCVDNPMV